MAENSNLLTRGIKGAVGKSVVFKTVNGKPIATAYPDRSQVKFTKKQVAYQILFAQATRYASEVLRDHESRAVYELQKRSSTKSKRQLSMFHYVVQEYMILHSNKLPVNTIERTVEKYTAAYQLNDRQTEVLRYIAIHSEISNADYRRLTGVSKPTATRHLSDLVKQGLIIGSSRGAGAVYKLAPFG